MTYYNVGPIKLGKGRQPANEEEGHSRVKEANIITHAYSPVHVNLKA